MQADSKALREKVVAFLSHYERDVVLDELRKCIKFLPVAKQWNIALSLQEELGSVLGCEILSAFFTQEKLIEDKEYQHYESSSSLIVVTPSSVDVYRKFCEAVGLDEATSIRFVILAYD